MAVEAARHLTRLWSWTLRCRNGRARSTRRILSYYPDAVDRPYIIALTASAQRTDCLDSGPVAYLQKPIRIADLADELARALTAGRGWPNQ